MIVEVAQEAVNNAADVKKRVDALKKDGKKSVLLLVSNADGELRFVALSVQYGLEPRALTSSLRRATQSSVEVPTHRAWQPTRDGSDEPGMTRVSPSQTRPADSPAHRAAR